jgi:hypothetical protein
MSPPTEGRATYCFWSVSLLLGLSTFLLESPLDIVLFIRAFHLSVGIVLFIIFFLAKKKFTP